MLHIVNGEKSNSVAIASFQKNIDYLNQKYNGTLYYGFALSELDNSKIIIDVLIVTKEKGLLAINFSSGDTESDINEIDRIYLLLRSMLEKNSRLRRRTDLAVTISRVNYVLSETDIPPSGEPVDYVTEANFKDYYDGLTVFEERYFEALNESLDKVVSAKPKKVRNFLKNPDSKGSIIKAIELEVANMDRWQRTAAYEMPNKPQRIRGLAGSGKTVVLALKAAYIHFLKPEADIAVTFYSRSLYQQFKQLISEFYQQFSDGKVDFDKVHILHSWGTLSEPGIYSTAAEKIKAEIYTFKRAQSAFGNKNAFGGICQELLTSFQMKNVDNLPLYDYVLIDEAQDMPSSFFRLVYKLFRTPEKRIVYAYDELQTLNESSMPSLIEMFGVDENNNPLVQIENSSDLSQPQTDIILPICYRNTKWALTIAHALGFGIYRNSTQPLVQFFDDLDVWRDIGYEETGGELSFNSFVKLQRKESATPKYFANLMTDSDAVFVHDAFETKSAEYKWVAQQIKKNIEEDELDPDDILVILPEPLKSYENYDVLEKYLSMAGIKSIMPGKNVSRDVFTEKGSVTCTHIHRAKGNERPMVYLVDGEYGAKKVDLISVRNTLFTAVTRSRAWVRITGTGSGMAEIKQEVQKCVIKDYSLEIEIPSEEEIKELNLLNQDANQEKKKQINNAEKFAEYLIDMIRKGELNTDSIPQLNDLRDILKQEKIEDE
ncbi:Superfamily I DNA and RNA helicases [Paenibacillus sp. OK060]|uniref:DEAD/DEAH box helicase n=1 Tax=Paenibacillus sp. OK060 TaxID=1881034 RepID=UPI0008875B7E|nr:ATP-binding domain-containing protein [Paenibacillus sp. OK060]SDM42886.1 Superfamily I DNA and RNA helicases [Paenibacillus sp. OK060]